jgi:hypothetical protein
MLVEGWWVESSLRESSVVERGELESGWEVVSGLEDLEVIEGSLSWKFDRWCGLVCCWLAAVVRSGSSSDFLLLTDC